MNGPIRSRSAQIVTLAFAVFAQLLASGYLAAQESRKIGDQSFLLQKGKWFLESRGRRYAVNPRVVTVKFKRGVKTEGVNAILDAQKLSRIRSNALGYVDVKLPEGENPLDYVEKLLKEKNVESAEVNTVGEYWAVMNPNDPKFPDQWHLPKTNVAPNPTDSAWEITTGSPKCIVAVLDSGTDIGHEDLIGNMWVNPGEDADNDGAIDPANPDHLDSDDKNAADDDSNGFVDDLCGWDFHNNNNNVRGPFYHGTHVTGIVAAMTNSGKGVAGVAGGYGNKPGTKVMALGVGDNAPDGSVLDDAIIYASDNGAHIITMSLNVGQSAAIDAALAYAHGQGVFIDCAAGNTNGGAVTYPATDGHVVAVGSTTQTDTKAAHSAKGPELELAAPGVDITSTRNNNGYGTGDGTSYAAPQVAGLAALICACNSSLSNEQIRTVLQTTAVDLGAAGRDDEFGYGRIDALAALRLACPLDHFKVYPVRPQRAEAGVRVKGQFDRKYQAVKLVSLSHFANPVTKNKEKLHNKDAHFNWYSIRFVQPPKDKISVEVKNQFGTHKFVIAQPAVFLLAPAVKHEKDHKPPKGLDHYLAYKILDAVMLDRKVDLADQWAKEEAKVQRAILFCVPVEKIHDKKEFKIHNERDHLTVYELSVKPKERDVVSEDQFDKHELQVIPRPNWLCVPSLKKVIAKPRPTMQPVVPTKCPMVKTKCPEVKTKCPEVKTKCPAVKTKCPPVQTRCPEVKTKCPPCPSEGYKLDHFKVYPVKPQKTAVRIKVKGQFDEEPFEIQLTAAVRFANPVVKSETGDGESKLIDEDAHQVWYAARRLSDPPTRSITVEVTNQFGRDKLQLARPPRMFITPAEKRGHKFPKLQDHFLVYRVLRSSTFKPRDVVLRDQWDRQRVEVRRPIFFCVPVEKTHNGEEFRINNKEDHLTVYELDVRAKERDVGARDQFEARGLNVVEQPIWLCVPSKKEIREGPATMRPVAPTRCPVVKTKCPPVKTKCPPLPTVCAKGKTVCPAVKTRCPALRTRCPEAKTKCPFVETRCPPVKTKCPAKLTKCPAYPTICAAEETQCPAAATRCPPVLTKCPPKRTSCPPAITVCLRGETRCPATITKCPPILTTCPPTRTLCPMTVTVCRRGATVCPAGKTKCPAVLTKCPAVKTKCPVLFTACTKGKTACPAVATRCPPGLTKCVRGETFCPAVATRCIGIPTHCPLSWDCIEIEIPEWRDKWPELEKVYPRDLPPGLESPANPKKGDPKKQSNKSSDRSSSSAAISIANIPTRTTRLPPPRR